MMNEIEKAIFAIQMAKDLLAHDKKILAVKLICRLYKVGLKPAKDFVDLLQDNNYGQENVPASD